MFRRRQDAAAPRCDPLASSDEELKVHSAVLAYVVGEGHHDETVFTLAQKISPSQDSDAVERAVRDLDREELLAIDGGKVVPRDAWRTQSVNR